MDLINGAFCRARETTIQLLNSKMSLHIVREPLASQYDLILDAILCSDGQLS